MIYELKTSQKEVGKKTRNCNSNIELLCHFSVGLRSYNSNTELLCHFSEGLVIRTSPGQSTGMTGLKLLVVWTSRLT